MSEAEAKANVLINNDTYENGNKNNHSTVNNTASTNNSIAKPLKVKRTPNAYILFCEDNRGDILKENPKFGVVSVARVLCTYTQNSLLIYLAIGDDVECTGKRIKGNISGESETIINS